jgi:hypothetical protein
VTWLAVELWPFLVLSAVVGFLVTVLSSVRRLKVRRVVVSVRDVVVDEPLGVVPAPGASVSPVPAAAGAESGTPDSPFPVLPGLAGRPWEAEEEWSRPVRRSGPVPSTAPASGGWGDDWDDAAASWRDWADEAVGRSRSLGEEPAPAPAPSVPLVNPVPAGAIDTPSRYDDAPFPHAQPVEAFEVFEVDRDRLERERVERAGWGSASGPGG